MLLLPGLGASKLLQFEGSLVMPITKTEYFYNIDQIKVDYALLQLFKPSKNPE
jgi:hypothetical protein